MNRLEWVEEKLKKYKPNKMGDPNIWRVRFEKKWFGISSGEVVSLETMITLQKNINKMLNEDIK
jgi:hypothetical protein